MSNIEISYTDNDKLSIPTDVIIEYLPTFFTKAEALMEGKKYGWNSAIKIKRRFEYVWIVGKKDFQDEFLGYKWEVYNFPSLEWNGQKMDVLQVRKYIGKK